MFSEQTIQKEFHVLDMDAVHNFAKDAQVMIIDAICRRTNLVNGNTWDFLKTELNPSTKMYDHIKRYYTLCCVSDTAGAAFVPDALTMIDSGLTPTEIGSIFEKPEIASGMKKLSDSNVRKVLSFICNEYFQRSAPFNYKDPEYFTVDIDQNEISHSTGTSADDVLDALEKLISLHIVELSTENGTHYPLHKAKVIETAATFRLIERFIHNQVGTGCGELFALSQF